MVCSYGLEGLGFRVYNPKPKGSGFRVQGFGLIHPAASRDRSPPSVET